MFSLTSFLLLFPNKQLQSLKPASGWYNYSSTCIPSKKDWIGGFISDCEKHSNQNDLIPLHVINNQTIRIASYNIHFWCKPGVLPFNYATGKNRHNLQDIEDNFENVLSVIKNINADIICLQEVLMFNPPIIKNELKKLGYNYVSFFDEADWAGSILCVAIASKYPFHKEPFGKTFAIDKTSSAHPFEKHCFLSATVSLPNNKKITAYTSHFDCFDDSETIRYEEVKEIIEDCDLSTDNCFICGDFNAVRSRDLQYVVNNQTAWYWLNHDNINRTKNPTQTKALSLLETHEFNDCFSNANIGMPKFSVWNGTMVDFIFLNKHWSFPISGCYFYYTSVSDHLPVVLDINLN